jgi:PTS system galactosamine-specific IIB component
VVADDLTAQDRLMQRLMESTAKTSGAGIRFYRVDEVAGILPRASAEQRIFLVVRTPQAAAELLAAGVPLESINVGNMHYSRGKRPLNKKVYVDREDVAALETLLRECREVYIQDVPGAAREELRERMLASIRFDEE